MIVVIVLVQKISLLFMVLFNLLVSTTYFRYSNESIYLKARIFVPLQLEGDEFLPDLSTDAKGANWFDRDTKLLWMVIGGGDPVDIKTSPLVVVTFGVPAQTVDEFFGEKMVENFAAFFNIPASKIKIVTGSRESRRKKRAETIDVSISGKMCFYNADFYL